MSDAPSRRLAAVIAADVAGYSRLMGEDEAGTLDALRSLRRELLAPTVADHHGQVVKNMGDGWLVTFPSVGAATACAVAIQAELARRDGLRIRIGLHLGDITHEDDDVYGDGVNIAARLQELAAPGGILLSDAAHRSLDGQLAAQFDDIGERPLKNIARPVRLFHWRDGPAPAEPAAPGAGARGRNLVFAVLPFRIVTDGDDAEMLGDAILDDLTDSVSRLRWLRVIAAATTRQFPPGNRDLAAIAAELHADYLLAGDLRKAGERVRASVRLIDSTGRQVAAERFEGQYADLFDLQDDIVARVVHSLEPNLMEAEYAALRDRPAKDFDLWSRIVELRRAVYSFNREKAEQVEALAERILAEDPDNAYVCALAAFALAIRAGNGWHADPQAAWSRARRLVQRGLALDPTNQQCQFVNGLVELFIGDPDAAVHVMEELVARDPNAVHMRIILAVGYALRFRSEEALRETEIVRRLSPRDPLLFLCYHSRGIANFENGAFDDAVADSARAISLQPGFMPAYRVQIRALYQAGKMAEARQTLAEMLVVSPGATAAKLRASGSIADEYVDILVELGLPEN